MSALVSGIAMVRYNPSFKVSSCDLAFHEEVWQ
jgi:hypothetical protein